MLENTKQDSNEKAPFHLSMWKDKPIIVYMHESKVEAHLMAQTQRRKSICNCITLRRATNAVTEYYDKVLKPCGLTVNQFSLLSSANRIGVCSVSELAQYVGLERTTLARSLKHLFEEGYIEDISPTGTRSRQMRVTRAGLHVLEVGVPLWEEAQNGVAAKIGEENVNTLMNLLSSLESI